MTPLELYGLALAYLGTHVLAFTLVLRGRRAFAREGVILAYHVASFAAGALALLAWAWPALEARVPAATGVLCLHGIYSLSFLELWSLTQISYSLELVDRIAAGQTPAESEARARFAAVGVDKRRQRVEDLRRLKLVAGEGEALRPTLRGLVWGAGFRAVRWLTRGEGLNRGR